jgi:hypothetical protein
MKAENKRSETFSTKKEFFQTIKVKAEKHMKILGDFLKIFFGKLGKMQLTKPNSGFSEFKTVKIGEFSDFLDWFEGEKGLGGWNEWEYVKCIDSYLRLQVGKAGEIEGKDQVLFLRDYYGNIEVDREDSGEYVMPIIKIVHDPLGEEGMPDGMVVPRGETCIGRVEVGEDGKYRVEHDPYMGGATVSFEKSGEVVRYVGEDRADLRADSDVESVSGGIKGKGLLEVLKSVRDRLIGLSEEIGSEYEYEVEGENGPVKVTEDVFVQAVGRVDRGRLALAESGKGNGVVLKGRELYIRDEGSKEFKIREGEYVSNFSKIFREYLIGGVKEEGGDERAARPKTSIGHDIVDIVDKFDVTIIDDMGNGIKEKKTMTVGLFVTQVRLSNRKEDNWVKTFKLYMDNKVNDCVGWIRITAQTVDRYWVEGDVILDWEDESYRFVSKDRISIFEQIVKEDLFWHDWAEGISYTTDGPRDSNIFHFYYFGKKYREEIYNKGCFRLVVSTHHGVELYVGESMSDFNVGKWPTGKDWRFNAMMVGFKELVKAIRNFEDKRDGVEDSARPKTEIDSPKDI